MVFHMRKRKFQPQEPTASLWPHSRPFPSGHPWPDGPLPTMLLFGYLPTVPLWSCNLKEHTPMTSSLCLHGTHNRYLLWMVWPITVVLITQYSVQARAQWMHTPAYSHWPSKADPKIHVPSYHDFLHGWKGRGFGLRSQLRGAPCCLLNIFSLKKLDSYLYCVYHNFNKLYIVTFNHNALKKENTACMAPLKNGNIPNLMSKWHLQLFKTKKTLRHSSAFYRYCFLLR